MSASALFDAPGPRARRRHLILAVSGLLLTALVLVLVVRKAYSAEQLHGYMWKPFLTGSAWTSYLIPGLWGTIKAAALSVAFAGVFGIVFGMGRLSPLASVRWACGVVVEFFRAVPVLLMMVFAYYGWFARSSWMPNDIAPLAAVVLGLTLYNGSVIAELVRSGVHSLPMGQSEAGLSVGLTPGQTLRSIQLPQALTAMLPALISQLVVVLKDSALGTVITYQELVTWSRTLGSANANTVPAYLVAALLFIVMNYTLTQIAARVEQRLTGRGGSPGAEQGPPRTAPSGVGEPGGAGAAEELSAPGGR
jgi:glutamate transport system permease protein